MKKTITVLTLLFSININAQVCFNPAVNYAVGDMPMSIISTDFNGDGKPDLAVVNNLDDNAAVLLGTGTGTFGIATNFPVGHHPMSLISADFNGDGKADLATGNWGAGTISILLGTGTGSFGAPTSFAAGSGMSITSADFNGDGKADLAVTGNYSNILVLLGNGTGSFGAPISFAVGSDPYSIISKDFNGDGKIDLAVANHGSNTISVLLGTGTGNFGAPANFAVGVHPYKVISADFNGDNKADLAVVNENSSPISVLLGTGTGSFGAATSFGIGSYSITSADYNGDGKADLAMTTFSTQHISVLLGTGTGSFGSSINFGVGYGPMSLVSADFNTDGKTDLAVGNTYQLLGGSIYLDSYNISILLNMHTAIGGIATICSGNSTTLTASGASSYFWSANAGSATTASVSVSPTSTTTYTVTGTNGSGCTNISTKTITVNPSPTVTANTSAAIVWLGNSVTLTGGGTAINYTWTGGVTNGVPFAPTSTQTYTVTGTNGSGCTKTATVLVTVINPCTITFNYVVPVGGTTTSALFGGATTITNKNISVLGPLTVDNNMILSGCNVVLSPNVKISLTTGNLTLSNQTHLCACSNLWDGIYVPNGRTLTSSGSVLIENALRAVHIDNGGVANMDQTIFNRNLTAIELAANTAATSPISLTGSVITSRALPLYILPSSNPSVAMVIANIIGTTPFPPCVLKAPYNDRKGLYGINATDVHRLDVGIALAGKSNYFDAIMSGINLTRSNANVYNNRFQNLLGYGNVACLMGQPCLFASGFGISASGATNGTNTITIGGIGSYQPNYFLNTYRSIDVSDYQINTIIGNSIDNSSNTPSGMLQLNYGNVGIYVKPASNNTVIISGQTLIRNCETGIWVNRNYTSAISTNVLQINKNLMITANSYGYCNNGIYITDLLAYGSICPAVCEINGNTITETKNCIFLSNVKRVNCPAGFTYSVANNSCTVRYSATGALSGIKAIGCGGINISNNHTKYNAGSNAYTSVGNILAYGIYLQNSSYMGVNCNRIDDAARSMVFDGICTSFTQNNLPGKNIGFTQNTMHNAQDGFVLLTAGTTIGRDGMPGYPSNNYWDLTSVFSHSHTLSNSNDANTNSQLCVNPITSGPNATQPTINLGTYPFNNITGIIPVSGTPPACGTVPALIVNINTSEEKMAVENNDTYLKMLIEDSAQIVQYNEETHWQREKFVFDEIKNNHAVSNNAELQNFYNKNSEGSLGLFSQVDDNIVAGRYSLANNINAGINGSNTIEYNQKTMNSLILENLLDPAFVYSKSDISSLTAIAYQCALKGGNAVYQARNLLMSIENKVIEFDDYCSDNNSSVKTSVSYSDEKNQLFKLYPNPNNGNMVIDYNLNASDKAEIFIYDVRGKLISNYQLNASTNKMLVTEEQLNNGIYFYQVKVNSCLVKNEKVIIIK